MLIYKKTFSIGLVELGLNSIGLNKKGVPMILFFDQDPSLEKPTICSGEEVNVSLSSANSKYFRKCK